MRAFRFLGVAAPGIVSAAELTGIARRAEASGYSGLVVPDHLLDQHAPIPVLATVAAVTERLRIGTFVFNAGLRHPAVLAQDLASLDVLSGGRLEIGIGAGWNRPEHDAIGLPFEPVATRVSRLAETIAVLKGCFGDGPFSFTGEHFTITGLDGRPKPVQRPHPPLFVGGGGRRTLTLAGRQAQIVGLAPRLTLGDDGVTKPDPRSLTAAATEEKIRWVREAAGGRFDEIELNTYPTGGPVVVTNHARAEAQRRADELRRLTGVDLTVDEVLESPHVFIGSVDDLTRKIVELRDRFGISSVMVGDIDQLAPVVERLAGR
ncbi:TIGR03621 family F420-dependent LLM class oxidoreductase [Planosporangium sp. 12N6]|uniref:TIGR03621 family F420-dependent LLM class oxidoreductase n=1 Tax=Planosporangium spinosum TaxID=3402278 RepID=UPI003CFB2B21